MSDNSERINLSKPRQLVHQWRQGNWLYHREICFFSDLSMALYLSNSACFCQNYSVPSTCSCAVPIMSNCQGCAVAQTSSPSVPYIIPPSLLLRGVRAGLLRGSTPHTPNFH